jgi:hypothetical protein
MTIAFESPEQPEVIALIAELDAYQDNAVPARKQARTGPRFVETTQCLVCRCEGSYGPGNRLWGASPLPRIWRNQTHVCKPSRPRARCCEETPGPARVAGD